MNARHSADQIRENCRQMEKLISKQTVVLDVDMHQVFRGLKFITEYLRYELHEQQVAEPVKDLENVQHAIATVCMLTDILYQISCDIGDDKILTWGNISLLKEQEAAQQ